MVGSSKFTRVNFQLQDIKGSNDFMGGLSFIAVGDFRQLPPVRDSYVYEKNHLDGRPSLSPSHWDDNFKIYYLSDKMRNQKDPVFANLCDRVGNGTFTEDDVSYLKDCVKNTESENDNENFKNGKISIIVMTNKVRQEINEDKLNTLLNRRQKYTSIALDRCTNLECPPEVPSKLSLTQTGGLESKLFLKADAPVVITSNHPQAKYKEDGIVNGARGYVDSIQVSKVDPEKIEVVWVVFKDKKIGKLLRYEYRNLKKMHKPIDENAVPILRQKKGFTIQNGEVEFQRTQFPLTLSYAITSYKCQGDTLEEVIIDFEHDPGEIRNVPCGSFYVALTRVKEGKHVFLQSFKENYITYNKRVEEKIESMRKFKPYSFKKVYINDTIYYTQYLQYVIIMFGRPVSHKCSQYIYYFHAFANNEILASADCYLQLAVPSSLSFVLVLRPRHALQPLEVSSLLHFVLFPRPRHALQRLCTLFQAPIAVEKLDGSWCLSFHAVLALSGP